MEEPDQPLGFECQGCCDFRCISTVKLSEWMSQDELKRWWLVHQVSQCFKCQSDLKFDEETLTITCQKKSCRYYTELGPFFGKSKLSVTTLLKILVYLCYGWSVETSSQVLEVDRHTISKYYLIFAKQALLQEIADFETYSSVQVDETAIGSRKYQRGKRVRQQGIMWLGGGVALTEAGETKKFFCYLLTNRSSPEMLRKLTKRLKKKAKVVTDGHKSYRPLTRLGYSHDWVNHRRQFVNANGNHTNNIERAWRTLKTLVRQRWNHFHRNKDFVEYQCGLASFLMNCKLTGTNGVQKLLTVIVRWKPEDVLEETDEDTNENPPEPEPVPEPEPEVLEAESAGNGRKSKRLRRRNIAEIAPQQVVETVTVSLTNPTPRRSERLRARNMTSVIEAAKRRAF